jgi:hypothetical protein
MTPHGLGVVSLGVDARIARIPVIEFVAALGRAGTPVLQYSPEEVLAKVVEFEAR